MSKTNIGLVNYSKVQLGNPYWWGGFGLVASESLLKQMKALYPKVYNTSFYSDAPSQFGKRVYDCVGLIKGYRWSETPTSTPVYVASQDVAVPGLYNQCSKRGNLSSMPDTPGVCVFMSDMSHVGVYIGEGNVIEARGHAYGVVQTRLEDRGWSLWGKPDWIEYSSSSGDYNTPFEDLSASDQNVVKSWPILRYGSEGVYVKVIQTLLNYHAQTQLKIDGKFGQKTLAAVTAWQEKKNWRLMVYLWIS